jgi:REP element-mobilizing transposase RayT
MGKYTKRPGSDDEVGVHVMSRVVQKRFLIDEAGMKEMRRILRTQAEFAGLNVITFCLLKNHFHILLHVDPERAREEVTDLELLRRFRALYGGKRSPSLGVDAPALQKALEEDGERAETLRRKLKARMGHLPVFMRELKTRFTFWYNENYKTVGTFWAERYRSVILEPGSLALKAVAAYIDLNAVRAGLAEKPQVYRYCGLGEAAQGQVRARAAYRWLVYRRKANRSHQSPEPEVFADYVAYVERILARIIKEKEATAKISETPDRVEEDADTYLCNANSLINIEWVGKLIQADGLLGFLRKQKPKTSE